MIFYIAGPMSGREDFNRKEFAKARLFLESKGHKVLSPSCLPTWLDDKKYLPICMAMIEAVDAVYMLDGWGNSGGARAEYEYARRQGKAIVYQGR